MYQNKLSNASTTDAVEAAAMEAAVADGLITSNGLFANDEKAKKAGLRRGKWTTEEEQYANRLIYEFKLGLLPLTDGTTLRTFLSKLLNCDPMRISKKFVGQNCIGKQVFRRRQQDLEKLTTEQIEASRRELNELERKFLERVAQTNRAKSSGTGKEARADYEDEGGNAVLPPWMAPPPQIPEPSSSSSASSSSRYAQPHAQQGQGQGPGQQQEYRAPFPMYQQQASMYGNGGLVGASHPLGFGDGGRNGRTEEGSFPRVTSMDVLNTIAQFNSPGGSMDNLSGLSSGSATALKQQQVAHQQQQQQMYQHRAALPYSGSMDPTPDVFPGLVTRGHSSTLTLGDSVGWPSFSNLNALGGGGGSMDDLLAAGLYNVSSASTDAIMQPVSTTSGSAPKQQARLPAAGGDEGSVGYPLDDAQADSAKRTTSPRASIKAEPAMYPAGLVQGPGLQRVKAPIVDVAGMSAMAHMYHPPLRHSQGPAASGSPATRTSSNGSARMPSGPSQSSAAPPIPTAVARSDSLRSSGSAPGLPKNGSVEDFWMLVNMGDLPQPEQDVLSQTVWSPLERGNSGGSLGLPVGSSGAVPPPSAQFRPQPQGHEFSTVTSLPASSAQQSPRGPNGGQEQSEDSRHSGGGKRPDTAPGGDQLSKRFKHTD